MTVSQAGRERVVGVSDVEQVVVFHDGGRGRKKMPRRGYVEIGGRRHPAWWSGESTAHTTCWLSGSELLVQHWRYHPQYDEAPEVRCEHFPLSRFIAGEGHAVIVREMGEVALQSMMAEASRQSGGIQLARTPVSSRPVREWCFRDGASGWNVKCTVSDSGVSIHSRKGDDGRTDEYVSYEFGELQSSDVQHDMVRVLGEVITDSVLIEASDRSGIQVARAPQPMAVAEKLMLPRKPRWQWRWRAWRAAFLNLVHHGNRNAQPLRNLLSLLIGVSLMLWLIVGAFSELGEEGMLWWHARVAEDLRVVTVRVAGHDVREFKSDGSWSHKGMPSASRKGSHYAHPVILFEYAGSDGATVQGNRVLEETFDGRSTALGFLAERFPLGAEIEMLQVPQRNGQLLLSPEQAPSSMGMLMRVLAAMLLLLFIYLPLVVIVAFLLPAAILGLIAWIARWLRALRKR